MSRKFLKRMLWRNIKTNQNYFYKFINGKLKSKGEISMVKAGEETVEDPKEVAEVFNRYFHSVY